jgi:hypothetical protein
MTDTIGLDLKGVYQEICANIRETDQISFKLLSTIPLLSGAGAGILTLLNESGILDDLGVLTSSAAVVGLALVGALIVHGIKRWEMRNIQKCNWLVDKASDIEKMSVDADGRPILQYYGWKDQPKMGGGKTRAESLIYNVAIAAWIVPVIVAAPTLVRGLSGSDALMGLLGGIVAAL